MNTHQLVTRRCVEIWADGTLHYRRPPNHPDVEEALKTPGYSTVQAGAEFSECERFRYRLWRQWDADLPYMVVIGLNPSTATEEVLDPTIKKCIRLSKREACGGLYMLNLFPWRDTDPEKMKRAQDPVGPRDAADDAITSTLPLAKIILCAWGKHGKHLGRAVIVKQLVAEFPTHCLKRNGDGSPMHPLYVRDDAPLIPFGAAERA